QLQKGLSDFAARCGCAGFSSRCRRAANGNGRSLWPQLLSASGGVVPVFAARISQEQILAGYFPAHGKIAARQAGRYCRRHENVPGISQALPALRTKARSAGSAGGTFASAEQQHSRDKIGGQRKASCPGKTRTGSHCAEGSKEEFHK